MFRSSGDGDPFNLTILDPSLSSNNEHYEIYRGVTSDAGASWSWEAITSGSDADNLRLFVPEDHGRSCTLVWFRGTYNSFTDFACDVGPIFPLNGGGIELPSVFILKRLPSGLSLYRFRGRSP